MKSTKDKLLPRITFHITFWLTDWVMLFAALVRLLSFEFIRVDWYSKALMWHMKTQFKVLKWYNRRFS